MQIKKYILGVFALFGVFVFSCNKEKHECGKCDQAEGIWRFESVIYRKDWSFHKTDLTDIYKDIRLYFYDDKKFLYYHAGRKIDLTGYWEMNEETQNNGQTTTTVTYIDWYGEDHSGNYEEGKWSNVSISKRGMKATEKKYGGTYSFKLVRD